MLFLLKDRRLIGVLPIAAAVLVALAPAAITSRAYSMFDMNDPTNRDRVAMLEAGRAIVRDHPLTGVGPDMVRMVYPPITAMPWAVEPTNAHLHNVPVQIAAERGLPALGRLAVVRGGADTRAVAADRHGRGCRRWPPPAWPRSRRCSPPGSSSTTSATLSS